MVNNKATVFVIPRQLLILATFNYYVLCVRHGAKHCSPALPVDTGALTPVLRMSKLRFSRAKQLTEGHRAREQLGRDRS